MKSKSDAYTDARARVKKDGKPQAILYIPGHVEYIVVPWYSGLERITKELGGKFIEGLDASDSDV